MIPAWVPVGLAAVIIGVLGTLFDKYLLERFFHSHDDEDAGPGALLIFSSYFAILIVIGIFLFSNQNISFHISHGLVGVLAGILNGVWILLYLYAINRTDLSKVVPIFQIIPAFGIILAYISLGELITFEQVCAITVIITGTLVLLHIPGKSFFSIDFVTLLLMTSASFLVALSQTIFKALTLETNYTTAAFWLWSGFVLFGVVIYLCKANYQTEFNHLLAERIKTVATLNSFNEVFDNLGELVLFAAIIIGPIALVQSLNAYEPLLILLASVTLSIFVPKYFDEDISKTSIAQKLLGIFIITAGSIYLYTII